MRLLAGLLGRTGLSPEARTFVASEITARRWKYLVFLLLSVVAAIIEMTGVGLIFPLLLIIVAPEMIDRIPPLVWLTDDVGLGRGSGLTVFLIVTIAVLMTAKNAYMMFFKWLQARAIAGWKTELSRRLMQIYLFADYRTHLIKTSSEIIRNITLTGSIYDQFMTAIMNLIVNLIMLLSLTLLLVTVLPPQASVGLAFMVACSVAVYVLMRRPFEAIGKESNALYKERQAILRQSIGMIKETKILSNERFFLKNFNRVQDRSFLRQAHYNFMASIPPLVTESAVIISVLGLISYLLLTASEQGVGIAILGLLVATLFRVSPLLNRILTSLQVLNVSRNSVEIIAQEIAELEGKVYLPTAEPAPLPFTRAVSFENVSFSYPAGSAPALSDVSFSIGRNETVGITGPSGAGKSTLIALLMGLLPPKEGQIKVDGTDLKAPERIRAWHKHIGLVAQSVFLIDDTIAANIAFGHDHDGFDRDRVEAVLEFVRMKDFVDSLPDGIMTMLGEDGSRLSGGQRQRIGIARALYGEPDFLVLDEATSSLDVEIERAFSENLERLKDRQTMVIIAHRLSTLRFCDRIMMMDAGRIVDIGTFQELTERCPAFRRLVTLSQLDEQRAHATGEPVAAQA